MRSKGSDMSVNDWKKFVGNALVKGEPGMLSITSIGPTEPKIDTLTGVADGTHVIYTDEYYRARYEESVTTAEVWRLNDERNKHIEAAKLSGKNDE